MVSMIPNVNKLARFITTNCFVLSFETVQLQMAHIFKVDRFDIGYFFFLGSKTV
jgi:hypothetical protein